MQPTCNKNHLINHPARPAAVVGRLERLALEGLHARATHSWFFGFSQLSYTLHRPYGTQKQMGAFRTFRFGYTPLLYEPYREGVCFVFNKSNFLLFFASIHSLKQDLDQFEQMRHVFFFFFFGSTTDVGQGLPVPTCGLGFQ